jgi:hypothetical protein
VKTINAVAVVVLAAVAMLTAFGFIFAQSNDFWILSAGEASGENLAKLAVPKDAARFYVVSYVVFVHPKPKVWSVDGFRIVSEEKPADAIPRILAGQKIIVEGNMFPGYDERNTAIGALGGEITAALALSGKNASMYGSMGGVPTINCVASTDNCSNASIVILIGDCDCMKLNSKIEITGSREFLQGERVKIGALIRAGLYKNDTTTPFGALG